MPPTFDRVRELLDYDPNTGVFVWRVQRRGTNGIGSVAGTPSDGYCQIGIDRRTWKAHILAWLWMTGAWPTHEVDHINGVRDDNRWVNLRDGSNGVNMRNIVAPPKNNTSGFRGVSRHQGGWQARLQVEGKRLRLGTYPTPEEASAAYWAAKAEYHGEETYRGRL